MTYLREALSREARRVVVERLAGAEHETGHPLGPSLGDQELRATPVVAHEGHVAEVEALEELGDEGDQRADGEVGVRAHGRAVAAERQRGDDAPGGAAQGGHHVAPEGLVHRHTVQEDDDGAVAPGVLVLDDPRAQLDLGHCLPH